MSYTARWIQGMIVAGLVLVPISESVAQAPGTTRAPQATAGRPRERTNWFSDRRPLQVGEPVVLLVDEDWLSRDRSEERGDKQRAITAELGSSELEQGITGGSGIGATSRNDGYQNRQVQLQASLAGRVVALDEMGWATVRASRTVILNGRRQELQVEGVMRSDDLMTGNKVQASLLADAVVSLNGKPVKASRSIIGKILGALWP